VKIEFRRWRPTGDTLQIVETAEEILEDYSAKGYRLTLRQLSNPD